MNCIDCIITAYAIWISLAAILFGAWLGALGIATQLDRNDAARRKLER